MCAVNWWSLHWSGWTVVLVNLQDREARGQVGMTNVKWFRAMRPLLNFNILITGFFLLYTNSHQVPAFQVICKDKPLILSPWYNQCTSVKAVGGMASGILRCWLDKRLLLPLCPHGGCSSNSFLILLDSFLTLLSVWSPSCLLFLCSKHWRNDLPATHISSKESELSFISLKREERACGQQPQKAPKSPGSSSTIMGF